MVWGQLLPVAWTGVVTGYGGMGSGLEIVSLMHGRSSSGEGQAEADITILGQRQAALIHPLHRPPATWGASLSQSVCSCCVWSPDPSLKVSWLKC